MILKKLKLKYKKYEKQNHIGVMWFGWLVLCDSYYVWFCWFVLFPLQDSRIIARTKL